MIAFRHSTLRKMRLADILSLALEKNAEERDTVCRAFYEWHSMKKS